MVSSATRPPVAASRVRPRRWLAAALLTLGLLAGVWAMRLTLTGWAAQALLRLAGVAEVRFTVTQASPWHVVFEKVAGQVRTQAFTARRVSLSRAYWWSPSLGVVRVEQAWLPLTIDGSDANPWAWPTYQHGTVYLSPLRLPLQAIVLDGELAVRAAALPEQVVAVRLDARLSAGQAWVGRASAEGRGFGVKADARFDSSTQELAFQLSEVSLDLKAWQDFVQRLVLFPGGTVQLEGILTGRAQGSWVGPALTASGLVRIRDGRLANRDRGFTAEGVEVDLEFKDFDKFETAPGALRIRQLQIGQLAFKAVDADIAFAGANQIIVSRATSQALGGRVAAEPFRYYLDQRELDLVLLVENSNRAEVMALTKDLPAHVSGHLDGRLSIHLDAGGLRLGPGK